MIDDGLNQYQAINLPEMFFLDQIPVLGDELNDTFPENLGTLLVFKPGFQPSQIHGHSDWLAHARERGKACVDA